MRFQSIRAGRSLLIALGVLLLVPSAGFAHTGAGPTHGLMHGFTHPLLGWDHLLAMMAVGLWAGQRGGGYVWALPAAFVGTMIGAGVLGGMGIALPGVETGILLSVLVLGALIAFAARLPGAMSIAAVSLFALFHGHAHGTEIPHAISGIFYGIGVASATALLHALGIAFVIGIRRSREDRHAGVVRLAGAAISAAGVALWLT